MSNPHESNSSGITDRKRPYTQIIKPFAGELNRDDVLRHFSPFGDVKNSESMAEALVSDFHTIAGRRVEITADDDRTQDETTFMDMNDDCIHEILSTKCLSALDLCSVAETSRRLKEIAIGTFKRKHGKCDLSSFYIREVKSAQRILRNFGAVISDLTIDGWLFKKHETSVLESAARHCRSTLESLRLSDCMIRDNFPAELKSIFKNLQKLRIEFCSFEPAAGKKLFADCGSLVELELSDAEYAFIFESTFPKLQKFKCGVDEDDYEYGYAGDDEINFDSFILRHGNLTSITMHNYLEISSLLPLIGDNLKQLEELEFNIFRDQIFDLSSLGQLRKLYICCWMRNVMKVVRGLNNLQFLENLTLEQANVDPEFIKTLSQLKTLRVLRLYWCSGLQNWNRIGDLNQLKELEIISFESFALDFVALLKRLSNLKALSVDVGDLKMNLETYLRIVDVVRARPDKSKLTLKLNDSELFDADMRRSFSRNAEIVEMIVD